MEPESAESRVIDFEPVGRRTNVPPGSTIYEAARDVGIEIISLCGGIGSCDSCRIQLIAGEISDRTLEEEAVFSAFELSQGWRLACQTVPLGKVKIYVPPESLTTPQRLQLEGELTEVDVDPHVQAIDVEIDPASLDDLRSDTTRLVETMTGIALPGINISYPVIAEIPSALRSQDWTARLAIDSDSDLIAILPTSTPILGLAIDIGTTSIAAYLVDLLTGRTLAKQGEMNPQIVFGEDVISRIHYSNEHELGGQILRDKLVDAINRLSRELCDEAGCEISQIVDMVAVGNTAMHHLFLGLPVKQLGEAPYVPVTNDAITIRASDLGVKLARGANIYLPPIIAGYVGADHAAMLLATGAWQNDRTLIAIDIGTNTEVSLCHRGRLLSCSCASGPAFEGAHIGAGMRAAPGAIERVQLIEGDLRIQTIGNKAAVGLCGSGIVDAVAVMAESALINHRGALDQKHKFATPADDGRPQFTLVNASESGTGHEIIVTRQDVAEIQLAKGAIRSGIEILLGEAGISSDSVDEFIIAGAFGSYINVASAIRLGLFPQLPISRFHQVGNAAGMGAVQLLISRSSRRLTAEIARQIEYVELTTHKAFSAEFIRQMSF